MSERDVEQFNKQAAGYDRSLMGRRFHRPIQQAMARIATRHAPNARAILDVGCGTGSVLALLAARYPAAELCGVDPAGEMLRVARTRLSGDSRVRLLSAHAEQLPFADAAFDLVVSSNSFHHWVDQEAGLREIGRVLAPGAWFVMTDAWFAMGWRRWVARIRPHGRMRSRAEVETMIAAAGLAVAGWERVKVLGPLASNFVVAATPPARAPTAPTAPPHAPG
jgi:ubiquinone/menaquinone biosynthesis C-methylase UbiE